MKLIIKSKMVKRKSFRKRRVIKKRSYRRRQSRQRGPKYDGVVRMKATAISDCIAPAMADPQIANINIFWGATAVAAPSILAYNNSEDVAGYFTLYKNYRVKGVKMQFFIENIHGGASASVYRYIEQASSTETPYPMLVTKLRRQVDYQLLNGKTMWKKYINLQKFGKRNINGFQQGGWASTAAPNYMDAVYYSQIRCEMEGFNAKNYGIVKATWYLEFKGQK